MRSSINSKKKSSSADSQLADQTDSNPMFGFEIFDSMPDMYFLLDVHGEIVKMNTKADEYIKSLIKIKPTNFLDIIDIFNRESVNNVFFQSISFGKVCEIETKILNGEIEKDVLISFTYHKFSAEIKIRELVFAVVKDITNEKVKDIELQRFFNIVETSLNPILITDLNGKMIYVNQSFIKTSGYSREELIGRNPRIFGSGKLPKKFWDKMWQTISSGNVWFGEVEDRKKSGEPFFTQLLISPIFDKDQNVTGYFGIHRDLSEKRTLEKQLIHTQKMESIGTLAAGVAHEVGNPLASISALVQVAERNTEDDFIKEKLALVKNQVTRISKIIKDLVDFSRPSNFELQRVNINECLMEAVEITRVGTKAKNIIFDVRLSSELPTLPLVSDQLEQVFVNIVLNAIDAINENKNEKQEKKISIESELVNDEAVITFVDSGSGIKEENMSKIFEPFFTTKSQGKGTGLGLWVSYGIIKSFQGNIEVDSKPEIGTKFTIKLPIEK